MSGAPRSMRDRKPVNYKDPTVKEQEAAAEAMREPVKQKTKSMKSLIEFTRQPSGGTGAPASNKGKEAKLTESKSSRAAPKKKHDRGGGDGGSDDGGETSDFESDEPDQPAPKRTSTRACAVDARAAIKLSGLANNAENSDDDDLRSVSEDGEEDGERGSDGEVGVDEIDVGSSEDQAAMWDSTGARLEIQRVVGRVEGMPNMFSLKLVGKSYRELITLSTAALKKEKPLLLQHFLHNGGASRGRTGADPEWSEVERVISRRNLPQKVNKADKSAVPTMVIEYLVKWKGLEYSDATWFREDAMTDVDKVAVAFWTVTNVNRPPVYNRSGPMQQLRNCENFKMPTFLNGRTLRAYQESSVRWMAGNFCNHRNCILGDEMGLGKTAQSIALLESIRLVGGMPGPFLIVAPLTTLGHWQRELRTWTKMNVVLFSGDADDRKVIMDHELFFPKGSAVRIKFDVLLVSYERLVMDKALFWGIPWTAGVFDEAHKLKGFKSSVRSVVEDLNCSWKLMLTGTPIQNNMAELFSMMNMLSPETYPHLEGFTKRFGGGGVVPTVEQIRTLQACLAPILLRRMKEDVEDLPEKEEVIIWVELTAEQRIYYKALYAGTICSLLGGRGSKNLPQMRNLAMELRKLCCHPFLCNGIQDDIWIKKQVAALTAEGPSDLEMLTRASGKMVLLSKLLPKLRSEGKRVLIFSQFKMMLDQLENFLGMSGYPTERIDGSVSSRDRQQSIDKFSNGTDEECFVFLLSTRAGGMGITLTAADTCIIYDSDWNPQNDLQAMARCHRIGQTKEVKVYRLLTKDTYEEHLFQTASRKYGLDEAILGFSAGTDPETDSAHINELLKNGAHSLAAMDATESGEKFASEDIEQILSGRTEKRQIGAKAGNSFSVARFVTEEEGEVAGDLKFNAGGKKWEADNDRAFWSEMMPEAVQEHDARMAAAMQPLERGARKGRDKTINYRAGERPVKQFGNPEVDLEYNEDDDEEDGARRKRRKQNASEAGPSSDAPGSSAGPSHTTAPKQQGAKKWSKGELRMVEDRLLALGPGRYSLMMVQLLKESNSLANAARTTGGKLFSRSEREVQLLCEALISVIDASDVIARAAALAGAWKGVGALPGAKQEGVEGVEEEEGAGGGGAALFARAESMLSAEAKEEKEVAMRAELASRVEQLQPVLKNAPAEASAALNNIETLRRLLKNATDYKMALQTNRKLADLLLPFFNPSAVTPAAAAAAAAAAATGPLSPGGSRALTAARMALAQVDAAREVVAAAASAAPALTAIPTLTKIKTKLPPWWNNSDDRRLLRSVVMQGFVPWQVTGWVRKTLNDSSEHGFGTRVALMSSLPEDQRLEEQEQIDRASAAAAAAAAAVSAAAIAAAIAASGAMEGANAFPQLAVRPAAVAEWSEDADGFVVVRTELAWNLLVAEVGKRVKTLIASVLRGPEQDSFAALRAQKAPLPLAPLLPRPIQQHRPHQPSVAHMPHPSLHMGPRDPDSDSEDGYDDSPLAQNVPHPSSTNFHQSSNRNLAAAPPSPRTACQGPSSKQAMDKYRASQLQQQQQQHQSNNNNNPANGHANPTQSLPRHANPAWDEFENRHSVQHPGQQLAQQQQPGQQRQSAPKQQASGSSHYSLEAGAVHANVTIPRASSKPPALPTSAMFMSPGGNGAEGSKKGAPQSAGKGAMRQTTLSFSKVQNPPTAAAAGKALAAAPARAAPAVQSGLDEEDPIMVDSD